MGPMNLKPRDLRSLERASDSGVWAGMVSWSRRRTLLSVNSPDVGVEGAEFPLDFEEASGVVDDGLYLASVADDSGVGQEALDVGSR